MATYSELAALLGPEGDILRDRVRVAILLRLHEAVVEADDGTEVVRRRKRFAQSMLRQVARTGLKFQADFERVYRYVIMANAAATKAQILGATDAQVKTATDAALAFFSADFPDPETP
jgi:hypothetical protein